MRHMKDTLKKNKNYNDLPKYNPIKCKKCGNPINFMNPRMGGGCSRCSFERR